MTLAGMPFILIVFIISLLICIGIVYSAMKKNVPQPDRTVFKSGDGYYAGYARFSEKEQYLKIKLRDLEKLGVSSGAVLQVIINGAVCDEFTWPGTLIKRRTNYADLKRFKALTVGKPVIMGRKTFESIFDRIKKPLPDRPNIVISRSGFQHESVDVYADLKRAIDETAKKYPDQEIMVIGGASIYKQSLHFADRLYLTVIEKDYDGDAWFPEIDQNDWKVIEEEKHEGDPAYSFLTFQR